MEPFVYLEEFALLICVNCKSACLTDEVLTHLRTKHLSITIDQRKQIYVTVQQIPNAIRSQAELSRLQIPSVVRPQIQCLEEPRTDGRQCRQCPFIACQIGKIQEHCRTKHGWKNEQLKGRPKRRQSQVLKELPWKEGVHCQRFFKFRRVQGSGWFEVAPESSEGPRPEGEDAEAEQLLRVVERQITQFADRTKTAIYNVDDKQEPNLWLQRVGWAAHLQGLDRAQLLSSASLLARDGWPEGEEKGAILQQVWESFERVVRTAQKTVTHQTVGLAVLFEIARKTADQKPRVPFNGRTEVRTIERYIEHWKKVLGFLFRTQEWEDDERPSYELTREQGELFDELNDVLKESGRLTDEQVVKVDRMVLDLVVRLLDHQIPENPYESVLLSALAVLGLREDQSWAGPEDYTSIYSAVIKVARLLIVRQSFFEYKEQAEAEGTQATQGKAGLFSIVRTKVQRFMTVVSATTLPTPMDWVFEARSYGLKIRFTTVAAGNIHWQGPKITYQKASFTMNELSDMVHSLVDEMGRTMGELLLFPGEGEVPAIRLADLKDDASESQVGYSFLADGRNQFSVDGARWVVRRILASQELRKEWLQPGQRELPYRTEAIREYGVLIEEFLERLLAVMHLVGGQPARTTEILGLRHQNTSYGGVRNVYLHNGMVCFMVSYHKNLRSNEQLKIIHRYLPQEVGILVVRYLWLVLPFWQQVQGLLHSSAETSAFLWTHDIVVRKPMEGETGWGERAEDLWSSDRMRRVLSKLSIRLLRVDLNISTWRHMAIAISRRFLNGDFRKLHTDEGYQSEDDTDGEGADDNVWDLQAGHSTFVSGMIYAREAQQGLIGIAVRQEQFRKISIQWHRFLGFGAEDQANRKRARSYGVFEEEREAARWRRLNRLRHVDLKGKLRQMMQNEQAEFRGNQQKVIETIVRGESPIIQIASTGGGKSLSFMLPAYCSYEGVTVVVVPLVSLQQDLQRRCQESGIQVVVWSSAQPQVGTVLLITPESVVTKGFRNFVNRLVVRQQLDRVVVDECHMVLDSGFDFRPQFRELGRTIADFGVQLVFLTATLAIRDEPEFFAVMQIHRTQAKIFRGVTSRKNIRYQVQEVDNVQEEEEAVVRKINRQLTRTTDNKIIVYCQRIDQAEELAGVLKCPVYFSLGTIMI